MNVEDELLDSYLAALGAFYDARKLSLTRWLLHDSDAREATEARLLEVRHIYWSYIEASHSRSQTEGPANFLMPDRLPFVEKARQPESRAEEAGTGKVAVLHF